MVQEAAKKVEAVAQPVKEEAAAASEEAQAQAATVASVVLERAQSVKEQLAVVATQAAEVASQLTETTHVSHQHTVAWMLQPESGALMGPVLFRRSLQQLHVCVVCFSLCSCMVLHAVDSTSKGGMWKLCVISWGSLWPHQVSVL